MAPTPFDLNRALRDWRSRLDAAGSCRTEDVDEMESHLRDSISALEARGLTSDEAFLVAARRLGPVPELAAEMGKVHAAEVFRTRAIWMLAGMLLLGLLGDVSRVISDALVLAGSRFDAGSLGLGWVGVLGALLPLIVAAVVFARFASGHLGASGSDRPNRFWHVATQAPVLLATLLAARAASWASTVATARALDPSMLGGVYLVRGWGQAAGGFLFVVVASLFLVWLLRRGSKAPAVSTALMLVGALLALTGAAPRVEAAPPTLMHLAAATPAVGYEDALKSWRGGNKDEALAKFMAVDFTRRPLFPKGSILGYSESEYVALPRAVNEKIQPRLLEEVKPMKALALHVKEASTAAAQRGDKTKSDQYLGQLEKCGQALAHPDSLALLQAVGRAFTKLAAQARSGPAPAASR